ncbi:MAG: hypothetical protein ACKO5K_16890 [Armatimonadota bacterium]
MKAALLVGLALNILVLVLGYPRGYGALSPRSRLYRTGGLGLLLVLLVVGVAYVSLPPLDGTRITAFRHLMLFSIGVMLALSLACVAVLDALESWSVLRREQRTVLRTMAEDAARVAEAARERKQRR